MENALRQEIVQANLRKVSDHTPYVYEKAYERIIFLLEDMLSYQSYVYQPERVEELHSMRIASKFLRYEMEIFAPLFPKTFKAYIKAVKSIQSILGDIHDADVWIEFIPQFIEEEEEFTRDFFGHTRGFISIKRGLSFLLEERKAVREGLYTDFVAAWETLLGEDTWTAVRAYLAKYHQRYLDAVEEEKRKAREEAAKAAAEKKRAAQAKARAKAAKKRAAVNKRTSRPGTAAGSAGNPPAKKVARKAAKKPERKKYRPAKKAAGQQDSETK
jgi:hypothetical protein